MEISQQLDSESWIEPIVALLQEREFREAYALAEYFPNTLNRQLLQFASLLGESKVTEASVLLKSFNSDNHNIVTRLINVVGHVDVDMINKTATLAIHKKQWDLAEFCIDLMFFVDPKYLSTKIDSTIDLLLQLAVSTISNDLFERGKKYLELIITLDNSPSRIIECAEACLVNFPKESGDKISIQSISLQSNDRLNVVGIDNKKTQIWNLQNNYLEIDKQLLLSPEIHFVRQLILQVSQQISEACIDNNLQAIELVAKIYTEHTENTNYSHYKLQLIREIHEKYLNNLRSEISEQSYISLEIAPSKIVKFLCFCFQIDLVVEDYKKFKIHQHFLSIIFDNSRNFKESIELVITALIFFDKSFFLINTDQKKYKNIDWREYDIYTDDSHVDYIRLDIRNQHSQREYSYCAPIEPIRNKKTIKKSIESRKNKTFKKSIESRKNKTLEKFKNVLLIGLWNYSGKRVKETLMAIHTKSTPDINEDIWYGKDDINEISIDVERYTKIQFPSICILNQKTELKIQLTQEIPESTDAIQKVEFAVDIKIEEVILNVNITASGFALAPYQQPLTMPIGGDSNQIIFTLFPLEIGDRVIEVEFFQAATRVGYLLLKTYVNDFQIALQATEETCSDFVLMEDPLDGIEQLSKIVVNSEKRTIHVNWVEQEGTLQYTVYPAQRPSEWSKPIPEIKQVIENELRNLNAFLSEVVQQGKPADDKWESICFNLQSIGANLFEMLIPDQVAAQARTWKHGSVIIVSTNEQWIPWELMYDGEDFWSKKFIIARYPRLSGERDLPDQNRVAGQLERKVKRIVNVIGGNVPEYEAKQATNLFATFVPVNFVELLFKQPIAVLVKALPKTDILHFTCHGYLEPHLLQIAGDNNKTQIENLLPETISRIPLEPGSLVFANACASTVPVLTFGKFSSFGWRFYQRGAAAFIGTLGAVPVKHAVNFAETVYSELFKQDERMTLGQAVAKAKEVAANDRNLFWLLYCIYGDPDFSIVPFENLVEKDHDD
jgi:hypothetical protein